MKVARHKKSYIVRFHLYQISIIDKPIETESNFVFVRDWRQEEMESDCFIFGCEENVLKVDKWDGCETMNTLNAV